MGRLELKKYEVNENIKAINKDTEIKLGKFGGAAGLL